MSEPKLKFENIVAGALAMGYKLSFEAERDVAGQPGVAMRVIFRGHTVHALAMQMPAFMQFASYLPAILYDSCQRMQAGFLDGSIDWAELDTQLRAWPHVARRPNPNG